MSHASAMKKTADLKRASIPTGSVVFRPSIGKLKSLAGEAVSLLFV